MVSRPYQWPITVVISTSTQQRLVGDAYMRGHGVQCDQSEALCWFRLAADENSNCVARSHCLRYGVGCVKKQRLVFLTLKASLDITQKVLGGEGHEEGNA